MRENLQRLISEYKFETWDIAAITNLSAASLQELLDGSDIWFEEWAQHRVTMLLASCDRIKTLVTYTGTNLVV
jgi:hypothetical protein